MDVSIAREEDPAANRRILETLTARLPEWFGQGEANRHYAEQAEILETWVARIVGQAGGLLLIKRHSPVSAEIYWLGVDPDFHRQGIGRALIGAVEHQLRKDKIRFLFVMTLHPEDPYEPYRRTRLFYERMGFELALSSGQALATPLSDPLAYYLKPLQPTPWWKRGEMSYRAVLFDVGGPLDMEFAWEIAVDGAIASACGLEGIRVDPAMIDEASEAAVAAFAPDAYAHMVETLCGGDPQAVERVRQRARAMTGNLDVFQLRPEIDGLLRRLRGRGLKLGIVANQPQAARERLAHAGIGDLFDHRGLSGLTGLRKPDLRAFQAVAEALGVPPEACIMVGDRIDNDIAPAKALGMAAVLFRSGRHRRQRPRSPAEEPDAVVTDVLELEAAILTLLG